MRETAVLSGLCLQPALPSVIMMDDAMNETKDTQRQLNTSEETVESDLEPMDISHKTTSNADSESECSSPNRDNKLNCPICEIPLSSQHEFTLHIRSHNNENEMIPEKGFTCRVCSKVLSSSSSLDRHVLVHSGERPFRCKICAVTFTTNGNMHRHMRTHSQKTENYESDGSTDSNNSERSRKRRLEFNNNNNKIIENSHKRKSDSFEEDDNCNNRRKIKNINNNNNINEMIQKLQCPVCERSDFISVNILENHLEDNHPEYEARCSSCNKVFRNHRMLTQHRYLHHYAESVNNVRNNKTSIVGFKDLTFVDFSSEKFPHIARYACEKNLHRPVTDQKFICTRCLLAFPCAKTLEIHSEACLKNEPHLHDNKAVVTEEEMRRENFFAHLDLQNKIPIKSPTPPAIPIEEKPKLFEPIKPQADTKDLADIQSILSMTSNGSLLQHLRAKPTSDLININQDSSSLDHQEEETQDDFAAEFRKMKLRGEFPCRLCTQVFPNLRALKGHNRAHLTGSGNSGPYRCNMCPHTSVDKAAVMRHMRTHNGDRPYECSLCNYAFTTKANCERHLRNRHAKVTREEVKKSIIYHPSEDPTNEDVNKLNTSSRDEMKQQFVGHSEEEISQEKIVPKVLNIPLNVPTTILAKELAVGSNIPIKEDVFTYNERPQVNNIVPLNLTPKYDETTKIIPFDNLKQIPDYEPSQSDEEEHNNNDDEFDKHEHPMDLSMDVLDLSKKKESPVKPQEEPQDFTKKTLESTVPNSLPAQLFLAQQILKNPASFYASQLSQYYQNPAMFASLQNIGIPTIPINPFMFPSPFLNASPQEIKERILRLQMSGGTMISEQFSPPIPELKFQEEPKTLLHINTNVQNNVEKLQSPKMTLKTEMSPNSNSVKMVIKNGVLMPKQKQRRYRTERPFSCEHCTARFTLRSNMERHFKQQHPQFWSQRQRTGLSGAGRRSVNTPQATITQPHTLKPLYYDINVPKPEATYLQAKDNNANLQVPISQQVKYAILAQQLKSKEIVEVNPIDNKEDDEDALVIDEEEDISPKDINNAIDLRSSIISNEQKSKTLEDKMNELRQIREKQQLMVDQIERSQKREDLNGLNKSEDGQDLVPVAKILDNAVSSQIPFREYFRRDRDEMENENEGGSEEDEESMIHSGSTSEGNGSGSDENKSEGEASTTTDGSKKKSAYSLAPNRVSCPYCNRKFPWTSSLRRHVLTHTGQKPFKCSYCPLLFTTKSNCDRHLLRKHGTVTSNPSPPESTPNSQNYMMRNVPERPYKCSTCPSSTFSTLSNLRKHTAFKHNDGGIRPEENRDSESHCSSEDERLSKTSSKGDWETQIGQKPQVVPSEQQSANLNLDLPFKCHLCDSSFTERQDALDHIKDLHVSEYELLMSKGALDQNATEEVQPIHETEEDDHLRGKFPDYANRKVICAYCMRRFWSAEDLRRHMRTHTGERPFSCDVCRRRFTLKHSMLRHRKKHNLNSSNDEAMTTISGDEDEKHGKVNNNNLMEKSDNSEGTEANDLIGNLLGIRDKSIIDRVLVSSADDAAKLLGVGGQE